MKNLKLMTAVVLAFIFCSFIDRTPWFVPKEADAVVNPLKGNPQATKAGAAIFAQQCVICHGEKGKGDGLAASGLDPKPANLTSEKVQNMTDGAMFWKISNGRAPMPSFKAILNDQQRWQAVNYLRELKAKYAVAKK